MGPTIFLLAKAMGLRQVSDLSEYSISELFQLIHLATKLLKQKLSGEPPVRHSVWSNRNLVCQKWQLMHQPLISHASAPTLKLLLRVALHLLLLGYLSSLLLQCDSCGIRGRVTSTASIVMSSAADPSRTKTTPVSATGTCAEQDELDDQSSPSELKGFRKRWGQKLALSPSGTLGEDFADDVSSSAAILEQSSAKKAKSAEADNLVSVVDETVDDLVDLPKNTSSASSRSHQFERDALLGTNLNVFKYPWEKGRVARIFGTEPLVKVPAMKLRPGGVNPIQINLSVGESGQVSAKAVVKPPAETSATFMQVVRKVDVVEEAVDKFQKRKNALQGFWELLSFSICSSTVGLKVTVEATADSVRECALNILDAVFAVKSPGTLCRRLYSLQAYDQWCVDHHAEHWLPVVPCHTLVH